MAKLVAMIDFHDDLWESEEMVNVFKNGTDEEKRDYLLAHGKMDEPKEVEEDEIHDEEIGSGDGYAIYYDDWGMLESVKLVKK